MIPNPTAPQHCVVIVGGACAGSTAAEILAGAGVLTIVVEQNDRPYGKIEDGLPRWHVKQRLSEYKRIDARLDRPNVVFVPRTRLGADLDFLDMATQWGLSAVLLGNGAWRDRPLAVEGIDQYLDRELIYQNPFIYWFNHKNEKAYPGPRYEIPDGAVVIGGGLASIDVVKALQVEVYERALRQRGVETTMVELEHKGIPEICARHSIDPASLGVKDCALYYRRRAIDMPLAQEPDNATPEQVAKTQVVRRKLLDKVLEKFRVVFHECHLPISPLEEGGKLAGLVMARTQVEGRSAAAIPGSEVQVRSPLVISSIGSIPEPIPGVEMKGDYYRFKSWETGEYAPVPGVFGLGNVVTGQGNIIVSQKHGAFVARHVIENYLGVATEAEAGSRDISSMLEPPAGLADQIDKVHGSLRSKVPLSVAQLESVLERIRRRHAEMGFAGYRQWIDSVTPPDLE